MRIMFVCDGNVCRSALCEYLMNEAAAELGLTDVTAASCGLLRLDGIPMDERYVRLLAERGVDASAHTSTPFAPRLMTDADLILTFTDRQLDDILSYAPAASRKAYLLDDFANLCDACAATGELTANALGAAAGAGERLQAVLLAAPFKRPLLPKPQDITDPHRRDDAVYAEVASMLTDRVRRIALALSGAAA